MLRRHPALLPLVMVVGGISVTDRLSLNPWSVLGVAVGAFILGAVCLTRNRLIPAGIALSCSLGFLAAFHFSLQFAVESPHSLSRIVSARDIYRIYGQVSDWPVLRANRTEITVTVDSLANLRPSRADGKILLKITDTTTALQRGDRIALTGRIYPVTMFQHRQSAGFDYGRYLRLKGIRGIVYLPTLLNVTVDHRPAWSFMALTDHLRAAILASFHRNLSPEAAALASGFLLGETRNIPVEVYRQFRESGTLHLLAVSGSNVALVLFVAMLLLRPLPLTPKWRGIILIGVAILFLFLSYGEPSVVRAVVMATLVLTARMLGRRIDLNHIIALTGLLILLATPTQLFDIGFQLSFITAWGLIFAVPRVLAPFHSSHTHWLYRFVALPLAVALVAQIVSAPVIAFYFNRVPVYSVVANLLIVPLVSIAVVGELVLLLADLIWPLLGLWIGSLLNQLLLFIMSLLRLFGGEHMPVITVTQWFSRTSMFWLVFCAYLLLFIFLLAMTIKAARRWLIFTVLGMVNVFLVVSLVKGKKPALHVYNQAIPGGVSILVRAESATAGDLIITGLSRRDYAIDEKVLEPLLIGQGITRLRTIVVRSTDYSTIDDLFRLAERFNARRLVVPDRLRPTFQDVRRQMISGSNLVSVDYYGGQTAPPDRDGWYVDSAGIRIFYRALCFEVRNTPGLRGPEYRKPVNWLVSGRTWRPLPAEWLAVIESGWSGIICARIEQYLGNDSSDVRDSPDRRLPDNVIDLRSYGSAELIADRQSVRLRR